MREEQPKAEWGWNIFVFFLICNYVLHKMLSGSVRYHNTRPWWDTTFLGRMKRRRDSNWSRVKKIYWKHNINVRLLLPKQQRLNAEALWKRSWGSVRTETYLGSLRNLALAMRVSFWQIVRFTHGKMPSHRQEQLNPRKLSRPHNVLKLKKFIIVLFFFLIILSLLYNPFSLN